VGCFPHRLQIARHAHQDLHEPAIASLDRIKLQERLDSIGKTPTQESS